MMKLWIWLLQQEPMVETNPLLWPLLDSCEAMLEQIRKNHPSAAELSATLPSGHCCFPAKSVSDSQSNLEEGEVIPTDFGVMHLPQSGILEDRTPTAASTAYSVAVAVLRMLRLFSCGLATKFLIPRMPSP
jgi:hypothetical protein